MLECSVCGQGEGWVEKGPVWFGDMNVDHTPPELEGELEFVMGSELNDYVSTVITDLTGLGQVYTHDGDTGNDDFLYNFYMAEIGDYVDENMVYGILVAKDGFQGSDRDPGGFLKRQLAIDTVDCDGNLFCSDYYIDDVFFIDVQPFAANERTAVDWPWPEYCEPLETDGYSSGEYSCWIIGIPIEYYATYKKIKVRMKDDVNNWRRIEVYDYTDANSELWIHPPEDDEDFPPCEIVTFEANISPPSLTPLLPYLVWLPTYADGSEREEYDEVTNPTGYKSEILSPCPPWTGSELDIIIRDDEFWAKAEIMWCDELADDIKRVTDSFEMVNISFQHPHENYKTYRWDPEYINGIGWGDGAVFQQFINYPFDYDRDLHYGVAVPIVYTVTNLEDVAKLEFSILDPPRDNSINDYPVNEAALDLPNGPPHTGDNDLTLNYFLEVDDIPRQLPFVYPMPDPPILPSVKFHCCNYASNNYQILIEAISCDDIVSKKQASPVINVWRRFEVLVYAMDGVDYSTSYTDDIDGTFDDAFIEAVPRPINLSSYYLSPIEEVMDYKGVPISGLIYYCDKQDPDDDDYTDFHDPYHEHETKHNSVQLVYADEYGYELARGVTYWAVPPNSCLHKHSLIFLQNIYTQAHEHVPPCDGNEDDMIDVIQRITCHELGNSIMLDDGYYGLMHPMASVCDPLSEEDKCLYYGDILKLRKGETEFPKICSGG